MQVSHSHLFEPVSLNALPKPLVAVAAGFTANASKQLPVLSSGTTDEPLLLFSASKQLPLLSGRGAFTGLTVPELAATAGFILAVSGLNWKPVSLVGAAAGPLIV